MGKQEQKILYKQADDAVAIGDEKVEDDHHEGESCIGQMKSMPKQTWPILLTELGERFSYYGIKAVLVLYLTQDLSFDKYRGKSIYHAFSMVSYFTGVLGAMIADSFLGKYKTIAFSLIIYSVAEMALTGTCVPAIGHKSKFLPLLSLFVTAIACGNIKPCLAAFGGDQFNSKDTSLIAKFFSMFYMSVNVGATFSMIFTPMLRTDVQCFGGDCYPATFGVPTVLIIVATVSFFAASKMYKKKQPEGNMMIKVFQLIGHALSEGASNRKKGLQYEHWLHHAQDKYTLKEIEDVRSLLKVLILYLPLPVFWALFHQQGSSWTLQAEQMDGDLGSLGTLRSDQIQFFNPVLVLILIPFYDSVVYPLLERCRCGLTPLKKMTGGMILAALAFVVCGLVQIKIQTVNSPPPAPVGAQTSVEFINASPCEKIEIQPSSFFQVNLGYAERTTHLYGQYGNRDLNVKATNCFSKNDSLTQTINFSFNATYQTVLLDMHANKTIFGKLLRQSFGLVNIATANSRLRVLYCPGGDREHVDITLVHAVEKKKNVAFKNKAAYTAITDDTILADEYGLTLKKFATGEKIDVKLSKKNIKFKTFGAYTVLIVRNAQKFNITNGMYAKAFEDIKGTSVHRIWQLPQYIVLTAAEVMFSVTGLEFAYSQAPSSMKSVLQACWLLTVAFGDLLVVIFSEVKPVEGVEKEMFLYGGLMAFITIIFAIMASFYRYSDFSGSDEVDATDDKEILEENGMTQSTSATTIL